MFLDGGRRLLEGETSKPRNVSYTLRRFAAYFKNYVLFVVMVVVFIFASAYPQVAAPEFIGQAVDCYLFPAPQSIASCWYADVNLDATVAERAAGIGQIVLILLGLYVMDAVFTGLSFFTMRWASQNVLRDIRQDLFRQIQKLSLGYYSEREAGDIMSRVTNDTDTVQQTLNFALISVVRGLVIIVLIMLQMFRVNVPYALLSLLVVPLMLFATRYFSTQARKAFRVARKELGSVNAELQESLSGAREVQAFNREAESIAQFEESNAANKRANIRAAIYTSALRPVLEALGFLSLAAVVTIGGLSAIRNEPLIAGTAVVSIGTVFAFIGFTQRINNPVQQIATLWTNVQSGIAGGERIFGLLDVRAYIADKPDARPLPTIKGAVSFEDVTAAYNEDELVLKGVNFEAEVGEMVAIVGPTGAGKTTIINLIPRFYDVTGGAVKIDGIDVRDVTVDSLRAQIGIVLQDTFLFSDTVMENIRYGRLDATDDDVIAAAKMVAAHDFIERLPQGYQTILGERGGGLSQGQRQLISIARVALMNPNILILDEATSSVDTRTERVIQAAFERLLEGRTSFVIAHRLSTIQNADQVMFLQDGRVIERGTHQTLLAKRGAYYDLYMSQFQGEDDATPVAESAE